MQYTKEVEEMVCVASAEAKPSATTIRKHESEIKKEGGIRP